MKNTWIINITIGCLLICTTAFSQNFYLKASVGNGISAFRETFFQNDYIQIVYKGGIPTGATEQTPTVNASLGKGYCLNAGGGYMFNERIGSELEVSYLFSSPVNLNTTWLFYYGNDY